MPLPPALLARLTKRGILSASEKKTTDAEPEQHVNEEIIAEDYDSHRDETPNGKSNFWEGIDGVNVDPLKGHKGCPNKYNIYHECTLFCVKRWRQGIPVPSEDYLRLKEKLLEKYPLPNGWQEVYDEGCGQHYYWNMYNNMVSWLPPTHPKASFSDSASHLREERLLKEGDESDNSSDGGNSDQEVPQHKNVDAREEREKFRDRRGRERFRDERTKNEKRSKLKDNDLDPMDPSSYSDVPRGEWSAGLDKHGDAKTGVDATATGPLFQMRPYPSPGAILLANSKSKPPPPMKKSVSFPEQPK